MYGGDGEWMAELRRQRENGMGHNSTPSLRAISLGSLSQGDLATMVVRS
jgi:hypothetical protein